jgi:glycosyltransferase involved in cell wall biosynthesis
MHWAPTPSRRWRTTLFLSRARHVVALGRGAAQVLRDRHRVRVDRLTVIPTGVPGRRFRPADADRRLAARAGLGVAPTDRVAAVVGAQSPEKSVDVLLRALPAATTVDVLLVAGDGPERARLEAAVASLAAGRVRFLGVVDDPTAVYAAADVVVLPSATEGLPAVLVEAGLSGVPVVATDVGFVDEVVVDGETGILVPPGDPAALARGLASVADLPSDAGTRAREHCLARFDLGVVADRWAALLDGIDVGAGIGGTC